MSDNLRAYTRALYAFDAVAARVEPDQWDNKRPCAEWTAREVLGHVTWGTTALAARVSGGEPPAEAAEAEVAGDDPYASFAAARAAALEALDGMEAKPPMVISLAKKEELIYTQARSEPIRLGRENYGLRLCQAVRDEAHRFAQQYHHVLRRKRVLEEDP